MRPPEEVSWGRPRERLVFRDMSRTPASEALLVGTLGLPLLTFVLNEPPEAVLARFEHGTPLSDEREALVAELLDFVGQVSGTDSFALQLSLSVLGENNADLGSSWATAAHIRAGGDIDLSGTDDDLVDSLMAMLRDAYPLFLLPEPVQPFGFRPEISGPLYRHPERSRFDAAVLADPSLSRLFSEHDEVRGAHGTVHRSTGSGGGMQLALLASTLLTNGWEFAVYRHGKPTMREHADGVLEVLGLMRAAIEGKEVSVPVMVGVAGVRLASDADLELPWGRLRAIRPETHDRIPPGLAGKLSGTTPDGRQIEIDYAGDLVMEFDVPYSVALGKSMEPGRWPLPLTSAEVVEARLETLRLALLLSWDRGEPRPVIAGTWRRYLDPLETGLSMSWSDPRRLPSLVPVELSEPDAARWQEWTERVDAGRVPGIEIAIRRTLLAAAERADPTDALVDAVIVWENLVGSSQGEQTLRISAALAWLLAESSEERAVMRKAISRLYGLRSKVVHGAKALDPHEAYAHRNEAVEIAIRTLRALFRDRPALLTDCKDSNARSLRLLLDE